MGVQLSGVVNACSALHDIRVELREEVTAHDKPQQSVGKRNGCWS